MHKRMLVKLVVAMVCIALFFTACTTPDATTSPEQDQTAEEEGSKPEEVPADDETVVYFVGIMSGGSVWGAAQAGFETSCEELGWECYYVAPNTPNDSPVMVDLTESAITNNADAIIGTFISTEIFGDVLKKAKDAGILVASTNCYTTPDHQDFWIGTDPDGMGLAQAMTLVEFAGDNEVTVVYMQTNSSVESQNRQFAKFSEYLEDYPNITVFSQEYSNSDAIVAADTISALVKANPEINAVVAADGRAALGLGNYIDEQGIQDSFIGIGIDNSADTLKYVLSGVLDCTIAQDFYKMGYESVKMIKMLMDGETVPWANDSGTIVIKPEDVEAFAEEKGIDLGN